LLVDKFVCHAKASQPQIGSYFVSPESLNSAKPKATRANSHTDDHPNNRGDADAVPEEVGDNSLSRLTHHSHANRLPWAGESGYSTCIWA
jgi:hypothetical protein